MDNQKNYHLSVSIYIFYAFLFQISLNSNHYMCITIAIWMSISIGHSKVIGIDQISSEDLWILSTYYHVY